MSYIILYQQIYRTTNRYIEINRFTRLKCYHCAAFSFGEEANF